MFYHLLNILQESTKLRKELVNDIYGQYECIFPGDDAIGIHSLKANVVLPGLIHILTFNLFSSLKYLP